MYNLKAWRHNATQLSTYQIPERTTGFIGPVEGGSGVQIYIPGATTMPGIQLIDQSTLFNARIKIHLTSIKAMISDRLINRLPKERAYKVGISGKDLQGLVLTDDLKADILAAINSVNPTDITYGFFFVEPLLKPGQDRQFDNDLLKASLKLLDTKEWGIRDHCISMLVLFGQQLSNYRGLMLKALKDNDPMVRQKAICAYDTFAKPKEYAPLECFENDDYATEVGMGSYLVYELRNQALETIEKVIGRTFNKAEKTEIYKGKAAVFWWDWEPFHVWKDSMWRKFKL